MTLRLSRKDLLTLHDLSPREFSGILDLADQIKAHPDRFRGSLAGKTLAMVFEKPSLRTRVTFETGMTQMGGHAIYLAPADIQLGARESIPDVARNLERWVDVIMARTFRPHIHRHLQEFLEPFPELAPHPFPWTPPVLSHVLSSFEFHQR